MLAVWIRFFSGWIHFSAETLPPLSLYWQGAGIVTLLFIFIFGALELYKRPQLSTFGDKIPRLFRATLWSIGLAMVLAFALRTDPPFSRIATAISFVTVLSLITIERYLLFKLEIYLARHQRIRNRILILGVCSNALRLREAVEKDPRLRSEVIGFLKFDDMMPDENIPDGMVLGDLTLLPELLETGKTNHVILSNLTIDHSQMIEIILHCERVMARFHLVPDLFRMLTSKMDIQNVDGIPLLGIGNWPLDYLWNRIFKRIEDIIGSIVGLILSAPIIAIAAVVIKKSSPGPIFYRQERCGESGTSFFIYKLRTMRVDAENQSGPVWAKEDDPRRTRIGTVLRKFNIDELPQFWNVLKGDMSLVGPRPERPYFVEQFKEDIGRYMWRHIYKPGITGWAQVNGLRGNTSIEDRIRYDLYYLENWSLAFDFKILLKTLNARKNAY